MIQTGDLRFRVSCSGLDSVFYKAAKSRMTVFKFVKQYQSQI